MKKIISITFIAFLTGCIATHTAITKRNLEVKTKMSETIFLDPVSKEKQVAYVKVRSTSGDDSFDLDREIKIALEQKGYIITDNPEKAYFVLQANVLQAGKLEDKDAIYKDFGDAIVPGVLGGVIGSQADGTSGAVVGAVAGATIGMVGSAFVKDVTYSIITDIQIAQKTRNVGKQVNKNAEFFSEENGWKKYSTRVISYANKVNLDFKQAQPKLVDGLVNSIAGVL